MRDELEDLSFQVLNPEGRVSIMRRLASASRRSRGPKIVAPVGQALVQAGSPPSTRHVSSILHLATYGSGRSYS